MQDLVSTVEFLNEVGYEKALEKLKNDWETKKLKKSSKLDYIVDEWFEICLDENVTINYRLMVTPIVIHIL